MDDFDLTLVMNKKTFTAEEIARYPYDRRKTYCAQVGGFDLNFYATDDANALRYLRATYRSFSDVREVTIHYRPVQYREVASK